MAENSGGGGGATEWAGESSRHREPTPPEWPRGPGETKPPEGPQAETERGRQGHKQVSNNRVGDEARGNPKREY